MFNAKGPWLLHLSSDGIALEYHTSDGWVRLGTVAVDSALLSEEITELTALAKGPSPLPVHVVLPMDQCRALSVTGIIGTKARIEAELDGQTPYPVDELAFDWVARNGDTHIVAVAKETLDEARGFADQFGFDVRALVAIPTGPWGTSFAKLSEANGQNLPAYSVVEPSHGEATTQTAPEADPEPDPSSENDRDVTDSAEKASEVPADTSQSTKKVEPDPKPRSDDASSDDKPKPDATVKAEDAGEAPVDPKDAPQDTKQDTAKGAASQAELKDDTPKPAQAAPKPDAKTKPETKPEPAEASKSAPNDAEARAPAPDPKPAEPTKDAADPLSATDPDGAATEADPPNAAEPEPKPKAKSGIGGMFASLRGRKSDSAPSQDAEKPAVAASAKEAAVDAKAADAPEPLPFFASRRPSDSLGTAQLPQRTSNTPLFSRNQADAPPQSAPDAPSVASSPAVGPPSTEAKNFASVAAPDVQTGPAAASAPPAPAVTGATGAAKPAPDVATTAPKPTTAPVTADASPAAPAAATAPSPAARATSAPGKKGSLTTAAGTKAPSSMAASEAERMTLFGQRPKPGTQVGGKPRFLGVALLVVLLLALFGVAAWAGVLSEQGLARLLSPLRSETVALSPQAGDVASDAEVTQEELAEQTPAIPLEEVERRYEVTGVWILAPNAPRHEGFGETLDDLYVASIDTRSGNTDAVALPSTDGMRADVRPPLPASPAPAGTQYQFLADGTFVAPRTGAFAPSGVWTVATPPALRPPARASDAFLSTELTQRDLVAFRPRLRPEDLQAQVERAVFAGRTAEEMAKFRPKLRPESAQEAQEKAEALAEAQAEADAKKAADAAAVAKAEEAANDRASEAAVAAATQSAAEAAAAAAAAARAKVPPALLTQARPKDRPRNFNRLVARAKREQERAIARQQRQQQASTSTTRAQPAIPTRATVARAATVPNVLNLRRINLLGTFGKSSSRKALVRLGNGRVQRVSVGSRLDGGRVAAISVTQLKYTKGGRTITLKLPSL